MASTFRETIIFFEELGIYDVVLPFLLVFCMVFAILEKTKILGLEKRLDEKGGKYVESLPSTRKNMNAMIAFVMAFFVVASTKLVAVINKALADIVLLLLLSFSFLLLVGSFSEEKDKPFYLQGSLATWAMVVMGVGVVLIFLNALGWLEGGYSWLVANWDTTSVLSIIMVLIMVLAITVVTGGGKPSTAKSEAKKEGE